MNTQSINSILNNASADYKTLMAQVKAPKFNKGEIVFQNGSFGKINNHVEGKAGNNNVVTSRNQNLITNAAVFKAIITQYGNKECKKALTMDFSDKEGILEKLPGGKLYGNPYIRKAFEYLLCGNNDPLSRDELLLLDSFLKKGADWVEKEVAFGESEVESAIDRDMRLLNDLKDMKAGKKIINLENLGKTGDFAEKWITGLNVENSKDKDGLDKYSVVRAATPTVNMRAAAQTDNKARAFFFRRLPDLVNLCDERVLTVSPYRKNIGNDAEVVQRYMHELTAEMSAKLVAGIAKYNKAHPKMKNPINPADVLAEMAAYIAQRIKVSYPSAVSGLKLAMDRMNMEKMNLIPLERQILQKLIEPLPTLLSKNEGSLLTSAEEQKFEAVMSSGEYGSYKDLFSIEAEENGFTTPAVKIANKVGHVPDGHNLKLTLLAACPMVPEWYAMMRNKPELLLEFIRYLFVQVVNDYQAAKNDATAIPPVHNMALAIKEKLYVLTQELKRQKAAEKGRNFITEFGTLKGLKAWLKSAANNINNEDLQKSGRRLNNNININTNSNILPKKVNNSNNIININNIDIDINTNSNILPKKVKKSAGVEDVLPKNPTKDQFVNFYCNRMQRGSNKFPAANPGMENEIKRFVETVYDKMVKCKKIYEEANNPNSGGHHSSLVFLGGSNDGTSITSRRQKTYGAFKAKVALENEQNRRYFAASNKGKSSSDAERDFENGLNYLVIDMLMTFTGGKITKLFGTFGTYMLQELKGEFQYPEEWDGAVSWNTGDDDGAEELNVSQIKERKSEIGEKEDELDLSMRSSGFGTPRRSSISSIGSKKAPAAQVRRGNFGKGIFSAEDEAFLKEVARMSYGSSFFEKRKGGAGGIGLVTDRNGKQHVIKFDTKPGEAGANYSEELLEEKWKCSDALRDKIFQILTKATTKLTKEQQDQLLSSKVFDVRMVNKEYKRAKSVLSRKETAGMISMIGQLVKKDWTQFWHEALDGVDMEGYKSGPSSLFQDVKLQAELGPTALTDGRHLKPNVEKLARCLGISLGKAKNLVVSKVGQAGKFTTCTYADRKDRSDTYTVLIGDNGEVCGKDDYLYCCDKLLQLSTATDSYIFSDNNPLYALKLNDVVELAKRVDYQEERTAKQVASRGGSTTKRGRAFREYCGKILIDAFRKARERNPTATKITLKMLWKVLEVPGKYPVKNPKNARTEFVSFIEQKALDQENEEIDKISIRMSDVMSDVSRNESAPSDD